MDGKYGRIFTEEDVMSLVEMCIETGVDSATATEDVINSFQGKFPKDEPVFVFRAQDRLAAAQIRNYELSCAATNRVKATHLEAIRRAYRDFDSWRIDHDVKYPD